MEASPREPVEALAETRVSRLGLDLRNHRAEHRAGHHGVGGHVDDQTIRNPLTNPGGARRDEVRPKCEPLSAELPPHRHVFLRRGQAGGTAPELALHEEDGPPCGLRCQQNVGLDGRVADRQRGPEPDVPVPRDSQRLSVEAPCMGKPRPEAPIDRQVAQRTEDRRRNDVLALGGRRWGLAVQDGVDHRCVAAWALCPTTGLALMVPGKVDEARTSAQRRT